MHIYRITNIINGKTYVGQTKQNVKSRWNAHNSYRCGGGRSAIKEAIKKYGKENFKYELLETVENERSLSECENYWINKLDSIAPKGYNLRGGGTSGYVYTDEIRKIMSDKKKGIIPYNKNTKPIKATSLDESFSLEFSGISEAIITGFEKSTIYHVINGKYEQYLGMKWEFC